MQNSNYSYETSLPAYYDNSSLKKRQQDVILKLVEDCGTCLKEIEKKLKAVYNINIPQSTVSGRISDLIKEKKVMYLGKIFFEGYTRKKIIPYKELIQGTLSV